MHDAQWMSRKGSALRRSVGRLAAVAAVLAAVQAPWSGTAAAVIPIQYDIDGRWQADPSRPMQCSRVEEQVSCTMVNASFSHSLVGSYTGPSSIHLVVTRRNRQSGCITYMDSYVTMYSNNSFGLTWVARDSNCDLAAGQSGVDPMYSRIQ